MSSPIPWPSRSAGPIRALLRTSSRRACRRGKSERGVLARQLTRRPRSISTGGMVTEIARESACHEVCDFLCYGHENPSIDHHLRPSLLHRAAQHKLLPRGQRYLCPRARRIPLQWSQREEALLRGEEIYAPPVIANRLLFWEGLRSALVPSSKKDKTPIPLKWDQSLSSRRGKLKKPRGIRSQIPPGCEDLSCPNCHPPRWELVRLRLPDC